MMQKTTSLNTHTLTKLPANIGRPRYDRDAIGVGIVHIGPGAFHRAHQAAFTDEALSRHGGDWGICAVSLNRNTVPNALNEQDGLYTLAIRDKNACYKVIGAIKEAFCAKDQKNEVIQRLTATSTHIVTLTITEKGYGLNHTGELDLSNASIEHDLRTPQTPSSAIGYVVLACLRRMQANIAPLTFISCDNIAMNGDKLKRACVRYAEQFDAALANYIARKVRFPNTMVDSITPAMDTATAAAIEEATGYQDQAMVQREAFSQWVIEDNLPDHRPNWEAAGVVVTNDIVGYEQAKLLVLNAAHICLAYLGLLDKRITVLDAISQPHLCHFVNTLIQSESIPAIHCPEGLDPDMYWQKIRTRFENPNIKHRLEQIAHDGSQKIPVRIFPLIHDQLASGNIAHHACFVVAAWIRFNHSQRRLGLLPVDAYLDQISASLPSTALTAAEYADQFLSNPHIFSTAIIHSALIRETICHYCVDIEQQGIYAAIAALDSATTHDLNGQPRI